MTLGSGPGKPPPGVMAGQTTAVWPAHHPRNHHLPFHKLALVSWRGGHFWVQRSRSWSHRQLNNFYACLHIAHASNLMENTYEFPPFCKNAPLGIMKKKKNHWPQRDGDWRIRLKIVTTAFR